MQLSSLLVNAFAGETVDSEVLETMLAVCDSRMTYRSRYLRTQPAPGKTRQEGCDESHAWLSVYCGDRLGWVDLDPTNNVIPSLDHITVGWGRDYADLCPIQGVVTGGGTSDMSVSVDVQLLSPD